MKHSAHLGTFIKDVPAEILSLGFEVTERALGTTAKEVSNFKRFYGEQLDNDVIAFSVHSKRHANDVMVVISSGVELDGAPCTIAALYCKVANLSSENKADHKVVSEYILSANVRTTNVNDFDDFKLKVNNAVIKLVKRVNNI